MVLHIILTGTTGFVGQGVLIECLRHPDVARILLLNRRPSVQHNDPRVTEYLIPDFMDLSAIQSQLTGYNACFFCAGISSIGLKEADYTHITYDITLNIAKTLVAQNPDMVFTYVSGRSTDSTAKGKIMWARVKGRTENDLMTLPFRGVYNFRPALMLANDGQQNIKGIYKFLGMLAPIFFRKSTLTLKEVGLAMIHAVQKGYPKHILEVEDIRQLAHTTT